MKGIAYVFAGSALLWACTGEQTPTAATQDFAPLATVTDTTGPAINKDIATLRQATVKFHDCEAATQAGWSAQITGCMVDPDGAGGMGYHYGNTDLINGTVQVDKPELLLYEPDANGRMTLVAVEYIIPYTAHSRDAAPPKLFGRDFAQVDAFGLWGLHAWVWKDNPAGMFAPWNPKVSCANAPSLSLMSH
jgi:hypothetical protein